MMRDHNHRRGRVTQWAARAKPFALFGGVLGGVAAADARAQIVFDGTLGPGGPRQGPNYVIPQSAGRTAGTNLFHSFSRFNVNPGESATFTAPPDVAIRNVLARVTGGEPSAVNGLLRCAIPDANLFLVNPAGIVFGPAASLDVQGAFVATTASHVRLADGVRFPAGASPADAVLTSAAPAAFGFLPPTGGAGGAGGAIAGITYTAPAVGGVQPLPLAVPRGRTLSLVGGAVRISGGRLQALGGQVNVVAAEAGEVRLDAARADLPPDVSGATRLGPVELYDGASLRAPVGGRVAVRAGALTVARAAINVDTDSVPGGGIDLLATGAATILNGSVSAETRGPADSGPIRIRADELTIKGLFTDGSGPVTATTIAGGRGGDVTLDVGFLSVAENGSVQSLTEAGGEGGNIRVAAGRGVRIDGARGPFLTGLAVRTSARQNGGRSGSVTVSSPGGRVEVLRAGQIFSTTTGSADAGAITIDARSLLMDGEDAPSQTLLEARVGRGPGDVGASGNGGDVVIRARDVQFRRGGVISASTFGSGDGGNITVDAERVRLDGSPRSEFTGFFARSSPTPLVAAAGGAGEGGDVVVRARDVRVGGPASISAESTRQGPAGSVRVRTSQGVTLTRGGRLAASAGAGASGGNVSVRTGNTLAVRGGSITAQAGTANTPGSEQGGNIDLAAGRAVSVRGGTITGFANGDGGRIALNAPVAALSDSTIDARSGGRRVRVDLGMSAFLLSNTRILTDTPLGIPETDISGAIAPLRAVLARAGARLIPACGVGPTADVSSFSIGGRGGQPAAPGGWLPDQSPE